MVADFIASPIDYMKAFLIAHPDFIDAQIALVDLIVRTHFEEDDDFEEVEEEEAPAEKAADTEEEAPAEEAPVEEAAEEETAEA